VACAQLTMCWRRPRAVFPFDRNHVVAGETVLYTIYPLVGPALRPLQIDARRYWRAMKLSTSDPALLFRRAHARRTEVDAQTDLSAVQSEMWKNGEL